MQRIRLRNTNDQQIGAKNSYLIVGGDPYTGNYEVTPAMAEQVLQTRNKTMIDDVTVKIIPVNKTTNPQGGNTVYIGGAINA